MRSRLLDKALEESLRKTNNRYRAWIREETKEITQGYNKRMRECFHKNEGENVESKNSNKIWNKSTSVVERVIKKKEFKKTKRFIGNCARMCRLMQMGGQQYKSAITCVEKDMVRLYPLKKKEIYLFSLS